MLPIIDLHGITDSGNRWITADFTAVIPRVPLGTGSDFYRGSGGNGAAVEKLAMNTAVMGTISVVLPL